MKRILFVDDESNVLDGLQRMLRPMRHEWEMVFVRSGAEALVALAEQRFDVMVSDMRMPGMNGAQLMAEVMNIQPQAVRIILSGYSDQELILKSAGLVHQYLAKPCQAEEVKLIVARACALRDLLADERLKQLVSQVKSLPSPPSIYTELLKEMDSLDASIRKIGEVISRDVGMTAKVLQLVNSAFFGIRRHVGSPAEAISLLGLDTVMKLTLIIHVFTQFDRKLLPEFSPDALISHSLRVGLFAKRIAQTETVDSETINDAFSGGLLHDVGRLVMVVNLPQQYVRMRELAESGIPSDDAEREAFGATHSEVGAYLLGLWGLPKSIIEAVAFHHRPGRCMAGGFSPMTAVHAANAIEHELQASPDRGAEPQATFDMDYLSELGLVDRISVWREVCARVADEEPA
ncbi:MAG: response regulator [Blastocatellia bacterium]|nr:response regulator [Blastocatellia bacterium]